MEQGRKIDFSTWVVYCVAPAGIRTQAPGARGENANQ